MSNKAVLLIVGFFLGNKGVPLLIHWIYIAAIIIAYKCGGTGG